MVWAGLDLAKAEHYIKLVSISEKPVVEGALTPMEHFSWKGRSMKMPTRVSLNKAVTIVGKPQE